jgi:predicted NUDIX family phosphoesterase
MATILVVPTAEYKKSKVSIKDLMNNVGFFMERDKAEVDTNYLQLIPYIIVRNNGKIFTYTRLRKGTEARLHSKVSVGIGGHVDSLDTIESNYDIFLSNMYKELFEELDIESNSSFLDITLLDKVIYDDSNSVGQVHLGVLCTVDTTGRTVSVKETEKIAGEFLTEAELAQKYKDTPDKFENWSTIALKELGIISQ